MDSQELLKHLPKYFPSILKKYECKEFDNWGLTYTLGDVTYSNGVYPLSEEPIVCDDEIKKIIDFSKKKKIKFTWGVNSFAPIGLRELLEKNNFKKAMSTKATEIAVTEFRKTRLSIEAKDAICEKTKLDLVKCHHEAFKSKSYEESLRGCEATYFTEKETGGTMKNTVYYKNNSNEPLGYSSFMIFPEFKLTAYVAGLALRPKYQHVGYGVAIIQHGMKVLEKLNIKNAVSFATITTSLSILEKMGAKIFFENDIYTWSGSK